MNTATPSRTVRVFLSSTFRDFAEERDLLVRKVFPELRRKCRERQVELVDVDLRWGITEKEAQQGRVLPICLAEVDRSRPWFMGFIGERYGWVPTPEQFDPAIVQEQPWLEAHRGGKSVTELEILHGVLNNPKMAGRAFFYFRDLKWSKKKGGSYLSEGSEEKAKLEELKERIRQSGFPVLENYPSPEALAERVKEDLWKLIDEAYPESEVPDALTRERMTHEAYAATRCRLYLGGERYFVALDDAMKAKSFRPVLITGQSGGGKSALLANWVKRWRPKHSKTVVIMHHLGSGSDAADPVRMAVRLMREISRRTGDEFKAESDPEKLLELLPQWLALASAWAQRSKKELLIVLDGLDKISDRKHLRWFPGFLPPKVKLVASCLHGKILEAAKGRLDWQELKVKPFTKIEQKSFIGEYLGRYRKALTAKQMKTLQSHTLSSNPLFLLTVLEELRVFGVHEELEQRMRTLLSPPPSKGQSEAPTVDDVFEHVLARIEKDYGKKSVQQAMEAIWASRSGLCQDELLAIAKLAPAKWAAIQNALDESLYESSGKISFGHDYLRKAVEDRYGLSGKKKLRLHRRLAEWFFWEGNKTSEEPWQWRQAGDNDSLANCLLDHQTFEKCLVENEYELLNYWLWIGKDIEKEYKKAWEQWKKSYPDNTRILDRLALKLIEFLDLCGFSGPFMRYLIDWCLMGQREESKSSELKSWLLVKLAEIFRISGDLDGSKSLIEAAYSFTEPSDGDIYIWYRTKIAKFLFLSGRVLDAVSMCEDTLSFYCKNHGSENKEVYNLKMVHGICLNEVKANEAAEIMYRQALKGFQKNLGLNHPETLNCEMNLANLFARTGREKKALILHRRVLAQKEVIFGEHPETNLSRINLASTLVREGRGEEAKIILERVVSCAKPLQIEESWENSFFMRQADRLHQEGKEALAKRRYTDLKIKKERLIRSKNPHIAHAVLTLGELVSATGRSQDCLHLLRSYSWLDPDITYNLACYECLSGNTEEAKRLIAEYLQHHPEKKDQALADEDFATIKDYIASL